MNRDFKIKLIYPFTYKRLVIGDDILPYGISVLASFLRKKGLKVELEDLCVEQRGLNKERLPFLKSKIYADIFRNSECIYKYLFDNSKKIERIMRSYVLKDKNFARFDLIGISVVSYLHFLPALFLAKFIKKNTGIPIVLGGPFITLYGNLFFNKFRFIDYMIIGSGEIPLLKLINHLENGIELKDIPGIIYRECGQVFNNEPRSYDLRNESMPDFNGLPLDLYKIHVNNHEVVILPYRISRGCINKCSFCVHHIMNRLSFKSIDKVVSELGVLSDKFKSRYFYFCDSELNFSYRYMEDFCSSLIDSKLNILWGGNCRVDNIDRKLLKRMKEAGCCYLQFGIESGSNRLLKKMNKGFSIQQAYKTLKNSYEVGIKNVIYLIAGYPHETIDDIKLTIKFFKNNILYIYAGEIFKFGLTPATPIYLKPENFDIGNIAPSDEFIFSGNYSFDEINGLKWKEKIKQQTISYRTIYGELYRNIISKNYHIIRFIPLSIYFFLYKIIFIKGYFPRLINYLIGFLSKNKRKSSSCSYYTKVYCRQPIRLRRHPKGVQNVKSSPFQLLL